MVVLRQEKTNCQLPFSQGFNTKVASNLVFLKLQHTSSLILIQLTFDLELHAAALAASLIASLTVVKPTVFDISPTDFQSGHRVNKSHFVPIARADLGAFPEPVDVYLRCASHLALKHFTLTGTDHGQTCWGPCELRRF